VPKQETPTLSQCALDLIAAGENPGEDIPMIEIWQLESETVTYYYVKMGCCDAFNPLYDIECAIICAPDGGLTGQGSGECPELIEDLEWTLLWEKE